MPRGTSQAKRKKRSVKEIKSIVQLCHNVRVCIDAVLWKCFNQVAVLRFYKTKQFAVFRNFRVISMRFAVFLCYSVLCLYVFLCGFAVFVLRLRPPP